MAIRTDRILCRNVDEQEERHPLCCLSVSHHVKPFGVGIQKQTVRVLVERHELYR